MLLLYHSNRVMQYRHTHPPCLSRRDGPASPSAARAATSVPERLRATFFICLQKCPRARAYLGDGHRAFGFNYDPSHFGYQGVDNVKNSSSRAHIGQKKAVFLPASPLLSKNREKYRPGDAGVLEIEPRGHVPGNRSRPAKKIISRSTFFDLRALNEKGPRPIEIPPNVTNTANIRAPLFQKP